MSLYALWLVTLTQDIVRIQIKILTTRIHRSEGFALTGYDIPGCVEDGAWMLWENSSAAVATAAVAHPGLEKLFEFHYGIGPSGVRGSIRLVFRSTDARILLFCLVGKNQISKNNQKRAKTGKNRHSRQNPL